MTAARTRFSANYATIDVLNGLRQRDEVVSHDERTALNKAGIIFIVTAWEAYVENLAVEAATHLAKHTKRFADLPEPLRRHVIRRVETDKNEMASGQLADEGWRDVINHNAKQLAEGRGFNTPRPDKVSELLSQTIGLPDIAAKWYWRGGTNASCLNRLNEVIDIRGEIVHTSRTRRGLNKYWLTTYGTHLERLVSKTDALVTSHCEAVSGARIGL